MSEPMSSGEIEDVLSSIRRLVSEDLRQSSRPAFPPAQAEPEPELPPPERPARLLLTPALRVVDPAPEPAARPEEAVAGAETAAAPEAAGDPAPPPAGPALILHRNDDPGPDDHTEAWPGEPDHEPEPAADRVARIGAGMARTDTWEAETGDAPVTSPITRLSWIDVADSRDEAEAVQPVHFVHRPPAADPVAPPESPALLGTTSDEVLDEALLREIVREVLRDELQGHLGERITRNIRKLVRAEVHRALTLKDWD